MTEKVVIMKIGFVIWEDVIAGGHLVIYKHAHFLKNQGHHVDAIYVNTKTEYGGKYYPDFNLNIKTFEKAVTNKDKYDIVISGFWPTFYYMQLLTSRHYFYFVQSDERRFFDSPLNTDIPFVGKTYSYPSIGIITEAKWIKDFLINEFNATVEYAPNGIDNALFNAEVAPLMPRGDKLRILIEGPGGVKFKRVDFAFKVANHFNDIEIWYVSSDGHTEDHWKYDKLFKCVNYKDMPSIYASCDIFLKFSTIEGFFGPPLEMMACGGACVVGNVTGYDEYIINGYNALVVDLDNEGEATSALSKLISEKELRAAISKNGMKTAKSMDWSEKCPQFENSLYSLMERTSSISPLDKLDILLNRSLLEGSWNAKAGLVE